MPCAEHLLSVWRSFFLSSNYVLCCCSEVWCMHQHCAAIYQPCAQCSCCTCVLAHGTGQFMLAAGAPASACVMKDQWPVPPGFNSLCPMSLSLAPQTGEVTCATCYNVMRMLAAATGAWHCRLNTWRHSILLCLSLDELPVNF